MITVQKPNATEGGARISDALARVQRAAKRRDRAREELYAAIVDARKQGESLRAIGNAAGLSHTYIEKIVSQAQSD